MLRAGQKKFACPLAVRNGETLQACLRPTLALDLAQLYDSGEKNCRAM